MGFRVNTNIPALASQRSLSKTNKDLENDYVKLSSGERINKAADDAAGLAISEKIKSVVRSARQAKRNASESVSMLQVAEGGISEIGNIMTRLRELSIQTASDTVGNSERQMTDMEYQQLKNEVQRIAESTSYNGAKLLDGSGNKFDFQVDVNHSDASRISFDSSQTNVTLDSLNLDGLKVTEKKNAQQSLSVIDNAITKLTKKRADLGSMQTRLSSSANNLYVFEESQSAANSRIRDTDYAQVTADTTRGTIVREAGTSVLAQASSIGNNVLKLVS